MHASYATRGQYQSWAVSVRCGAGRQPLASPPLPCTPRALCPVPPCAPMCPLSHFSCSF